MTAKRKPVIGPAFDQEQTNDIGRIQHYVDELRYYRPRGFSKLTREGEQMIRKLKKDDMSDVQESYWMSDCDELLTSWARRATRNDFIAFGPFEHNGSVGFSIDVESAKETADAIVSDTSELPRGFSGLALQISDHGNVTALSYSRGRMTRELFAVV